MRGHLNDPPKMNLMSEKKFGLAFWALIVKFKEILALNQETHQCFTADITRGVPIVSMYEKRTQLKVICSII